MEYLSNDTIIGVLVAIVGTILNTILIMWKTRQKKAEKQYIQAQKELNEEFAPGDYLCLVDGVYYPMSEVTFVKRDDVSLEDYLKSKEGGSSDET